MLAVGKWNNLEVVKEVDFGLYLDGDDSGEILLPKRYVPEGLQLGDVVEVFVYHDNEGRLIATTDKPLGVVGDVVSLEAADTTQHGAFLKWGIMKDLFVPLSQQVSKMVKGEHYIVYIYIDKMTGRITATERINAHLDKEPFTLQLLDKVDLIIQRETEIGYAVIINGKYTGLVHFSDVFRDVQPGDKLKGYIKTIRPDGKIDVALGESGYARVEGESEKILRLLEEENGYLPFHDKSNPEEIYDKFGMSKKTFKMTIGALYKQGLIELTKTGIKKTEK